MENHLTYESAYAELQEIATEIENETITVDQLAQKLNRAANLIEFCQAKLRSTETEVNKIIGNME
ncbi:exodeoxyribonuclease VII small subunit [Flavihumibacter sp. ZG627]|uniref:exodeoxyribonuclease VII small subunit n=1 Tax=Flavihumibacter sp. ZG627 TaxID=1463156 RepID=UPI00057CD74A|nr:exodeoxyribonuclease VII small subunit [Flavihumibacter sp. ZG627]KIC89606.1 exonuclease VII small subunit [Flavihumibacter sp. ZG627]